MECSARIVSVRWVLLVLWAALALPLSAQDEEDLSFDALRKAIESPRELPATQWAQAMRLLGQAETRDLLRASILARANFPRQELVALLTHERIAVRLGALEILEEVAGGSFDYIPWSEAGTDPRNEDPLRRWNEWAEAEGAISSEGPVLSDEQVQAYLRDLLADDRARGKRAMRMFEPHAMGGVKAIQDFLAGQPDLPIGHRARLKEAQYYLVLIRSARDNAAVLARDLVFGNRDQRLSALAGLKRTGLDGIPIVREYLGSSDALVRETAIDSLLSLGGSQVLSLAEPVLAGEEDVNVIHSAIRSLKEIGGQTVIEMIAPFLDHEDEDLVVSAIQTLGSLKGGDGPFGGGRGSGKAEPIDLKILKLLEDGRWRIRATALEYVEKCRVREAADLLTPMLDDPDEFVRYRAVETAVSLGVSGAFERLKQMFLADDDMVGPVAKAYARRNQGLDEEMVAHLEKRGPDVIVSAVRAMSSDRKAVLDVVAHFAQHENIDVSCAALRMLAGDSDDLEHNKYASVVLEGLRSGVAEKKETVLEALRLPAQATFVDPAMWQLVIGSGEEGEPTTLDPLYDAFLKVRKKPSAEETKLNASKAIKGALGEIVGELRKIVTEKGDLAQRAAFLLTLIEDPAGAEWFQSRMGTLSSAQRAALAESLHTIRSEPLTPIMVALLRDPVDKIRREAANACFDSENNPMLVQAGLQEVLDPERPLTAHEAYGWRLESSAEHNHMGRVISKWCREVLKSEEEVRNSVRILAVTLLRSKMRPSDEELVLNLTESADQWVRRAAWFALGEGRPTTFRKNLQTLIDDPSPVVREVLMEATSRMDSSWMHIFSDVHQERNQNSDYYREKRRLGKAEQQALESLAAKDSSERVRFEAMMVLMSHGKTIDIDALIALIPKQPKEAYVPYRIARYFRTNSQSVGRGLRPLLAFADMEQLDGESLQQVLARMAGSDNGKADFLSFESLVSAAANQGPQHTAVLKEPVKAVERTALKVVYFFKAGCDHCEKVSRMLDAMKNEFPLLSVDRKDIGSAENILLNQALSQRFRAEASQAPAIFVQGGALIHPEITPNRLGVLLAQTMELPMESGWNVVEEAALEIAKEQLDSKFDALTMAVVIGAGLLDGVNPCAFATIIFLLSYLQVAKRSPREILMVGGAFILAVFLAYLLVGLALHRFIEHLAKFGWMQTVMTWTFAAFAGLVAVLSFRDGLRARKGKLGDMTLQLPAFLKTRIRGVIRKQARARHFVVGAFVAGVIISFLELACTGQVYAPIIFQIQQGNLGAVQWLIIYNLAFITPLLIVFLFAFSGMRSEALITFQKNHTATVKFGMAGFFLLLCLLLIFGKALMTF